MDHSYLPRISTLPMNQTLSHCLHERDDPVCASDEQTVGRVQKSIHGFISEVLQKAGHLRKDVLVQHYEFSSCSPGGKQSREPDDGRVCHPHHNIGVLEPQPGQGSRQEIRDIIGCPSHERRFRECRPPGSKDFNPLKEFVLNQSPSSRIRLTTCSNQRVPATTDTRHPWSRTRPSH